MIPERISTYTFSVSIRSTNGLCFFGRPSLVGEGGPSSDEDEGNDGDSGGVLISGSDRPLRGSGLVGEGGRSLK